MKKIIPLFWQICLFRAGPEQVPTASVFTALAVAVYLITSITATFFFEPALGGNILKAALAVLVGSAVQISIFAMLLLFKGVMSRFVATLVALLGTDILLTVMAMVILGLISFLGGQATLGELAIQSTRIFLITLVIWNLAVTGFILHRATNTGLFLGNAIAVGSAITAQMIVVAIFLPNLPQ